VLLIATATHAQTQTGELMVVREQFHSMAIEVLESFDPDSVTEVALVVETERLKSIAENAFIEAFTAKGKTVRLAGNGHDGPVVMRVTVLSQETDVEPLPDGKSGRRIGTSIEARCEWPATGEILYRETLSRTHVDTVSVGVAEPLLKPTFLEKIAEPVVVISGAILIVYFLFTVRS